MVTYSFDLSALTYIVLYLERYTSSYKYKSLL